MDKDSLILLIDDEPQILRALKTILGSAHFRVISAVTGEEGIALAATQSPDVIILDLSLPDLDGIQVCEQIREWSKTPIIVLSVRDGERDKVLALDKGADDYLTKPFNIEELLARIRVALRHSAQSIGNRETIIQVGSLAVDLARHVVTLNDEELKLTATEFKLLACLMRAPKRAFSRAELLENCLPEGDTQERTMDSHVSKLRKKLEALDIQGVPASVWGVGYRFGVEP